MSEETQTKGPHSAVTLYVVHHPDCKMAGELAGKLYEWFRLGYQTGDTGGVSVPFWIRCQLVKGSLFPPIRYDGAALNIVVLLASHEMVLDSSWRNAILELQSTVAKHRIPKFEGDQTVGSTNATKTTQIQLLPAVLDDSFYRLTPVYENHNPLRLTELESLEEKTAVLRRGVLEMTARTLHASLQDMGSSVYEMRVFLSHAKKDGKEIAEELRDAIRRFGQLTPWYDANDLAISQGWTRTLENAMNSTTAGMVAVVTDAYPTRPWCRKELQTARTPWEIKPPSNRRGSSSKVFGIQPVVAVMKLGGNWTRGLATLEGVPRVGWSETQPLQSIEGIVDRLVLEMMLHQVRRKTALAMARRAKEPRIWFLTWVPDGWTMAKLAMLFRDQAAGEKSGRESGAVNSSHPMTIVYPGVELSPAEREDLEIHLQAFGTGTRLLSYQEWEEYQMSDHRRSEGYEDPERSSQRPLLIALSAGGNPSELARDGLRIEHVNEVFGRIVMRVLSDGHRIAFGGTLTDPDAPLAREMIETTIRWTNSENQSRGGNKLNGRGSARYLNSPFLWPLVNYSAYPFCNDLAPEKAAQWIGLCEIKPVVPDGLNEEDRLEKSAILKRRGDLAKLSADALSTMRWESTIDSQLRIVWGGKIRKAAGWIPGIFEEICWSLANNQPILILGSLGGCAGLIAHYLIDNAPGNSWPAELSLSCCADEMRDSWLKKDERDKLTQDFQRYQGLLSDYRAQLHSSRKQINHVSRQLLLKALKPDLSTTTILACVDQFIREVSMSQNRAEESLSS